MSIKEDLKKYPCFLFKFQTLRPIPTPDSWGSDLQCHHFIPKSQEKTNPKFFKRVEHLQKLIFMSPKKHYNLHAMGEDTFLKKEKFNKHLLLFNRKKWREGAYDESTDTE